MGRPRSDGLAAPGRVERGDAASRQQQQQRADEDGVAHVEIEAANDEQPGDQHSAERDHGKESACAGATANPRAPANRSAR